MKQRIAGIVNYRKPKFWVTVTAAVLCIALTAGLLTDPVKAANKDETAPAATEAASAAVAEPAAQTVKAAATRAVNIRLAPSLTNRAIAVLEKGQKVSAIRADTVAGIAWVYVRLDAPETTGWVVADYLNLDEEALGSLPSLATELPEDASGSHAATLPSLENSIKAAATEAVNVRLAPNQASRTLATLEKGAEVSAVGADTVAGITWVYVQLDDQDLFGWVIADYLDLAEEALDALPSMVIEPSAGADTANAATALTPEGDSSVTVTIASDLYSTPAENSRVVGQLEAGEPVTVLRTDVISGTSWSYVSKTSDNTFGWVLTDWLNIEVGEIDEMPNALAYFMSYLESFTYLEPERTARYLYFASDANRQNFLDNYLSIAAKATEKVTAISALADNLWCITWSDTYSFVGRMDGRLYVFPDVHNLPEHWLAGLDVSEYE